MLERAAWTDEQLLAVARTFSSVRRQTLYGDSGAMAATHLIGTWFPGAKDQSDIFASMLQEVMYRWGDDILGLPCDDPAEDKAGPPLDTTSLLFQGGPTEGRMEDLWLDMQFKVSAALGGGEVLIARNAGHQAPLDDPGFIAEVILGMVWAQRP